jgi:hypothetical protein
MTLERELAQLLEAARLQPKQAKAVALRLGWNGERPRTLASAGEVVGYTRERVRQLEERLLEHARDADVQPRTTEKALRLLEDAAPLPSRDAAARLASAGLSESPFDVAGLLSAARILGVEHTLEEQGGILVRTGDAHLRVMTESMVRQGLSEPEIVDAIEQAARS